MQMPVFSTLLLFLFMNYYLFGATVYVSNGGFQAGVVHYI